MVVTTRGQLQRATAITTEAMNPSTSTSDSTTLKETPSEVLFTREEVQQILDRALKAAHSELEHAYNKKLEKMKLELMELRGTVEKLKIHQNNLEQYSRRNHLRIQGLSVNHGTSYKDAVAEFINTKLRKEDGGHFAVTAKDLDAAHPLPIRAARTAHSDSPSPAPEHSTPPKIPTVIVRFHQRELRDAIIRRRRILKGTQWKIQEDLTKENAALLHRLSKAAGVESSWSWEGKIFGKIVGIKKPKRYGILDEQ